MIVTFEEVLAGARQLSPVEQMRLVVQLVSQIQDVVPQDISTTTPSSDVLQARRARIDAVCGKYAHLSTSSKDFARRKQAEIDLDERRYESGI